jgi:hypothetical protein
VTRLAALTAPMLVAAMFAPATAGTAAPAAVKLVDRALSCTTGIQGGARVIHLRAQSAFGQGHELDWLAQATVSAVGQPVPSKPNYRPTLAGMTAGWPPPRPLTAGGIAFDDRLCKASRSRVAFARGGLTGGLASQLGDEYQCVVPKTMLVRLRVTFRAPVELERVQKAYTAIGRVQRGQIAVTTVAGKPLVYAEVDDAGRARLFTSRGCT